MLRSFSSQLAEVQQGQLKLRMASPIDWEDVMRERYATFKLEEEGFLASLEICNSTDVSAEKIYYTIREADDIPENLKLMYREAVFGFNTKVRNRIKNRIGNMRRNMK